MNQSLRKQSTFRDLKLTDFPPPLAVVVCDFSGFLVVVGVVAAGVSFESECLYAQVLYLCFLHPPSCFSLGHMSRALSFFCCSCRIVICSVSDGFFGTSSAFSPFSAVSSAFAFGTVVSMLLVVLLSRGICGACVCCCVLDYDSMTSDFRENFLV